MAATAALRLNLTQSAISTKLRELEESLGVKLFERSTRRLSISTECYTSYHWLPALLKDIPLPGTEPRVVLDATHRPIEALMEGSLDIAIVKEPAPSRSTRATEHFAREHLITYDVPLENLTVYQEVLRPAGVLPKISRMPLTEAIVEMVQAEASRPRRIRDVIAKFAKSSASR